MLMLTNKVPSTGAARFFLGLSRTQFLRSSTRGESLAAFFLVLLVITTISIMVPVLIKATIKRLTIALSMLNIPEISNETNKLIDFNEPS